MQCQVRLRDDSNAAALAIDHRNAPDLMFLHQLLANGNVLAVAAAYRLQGKDSVNFSCRRVQTAGNDFAAKIAIRDHSNQLTRRLIEYYRHRPDILVAQHGSDLLRVIFRYATYRIRCHHLSYLHQPSFDVPRRVVFAHVVFLHELIDHLPLAGIRFNGGQHPAMLSLIQHGARQSNGAFIHPGLNFGVVQGWIFSQVLL